MENHSLHRRTPFIPSWGSTVASFLNSWRAEFSKHTKARSELLGLEKPGNVWRCQADLYQLLGSPGPLSGVFQTFLCLSEWLYLPQLPRERVESLPLEVVRKAYRHVFLRLIFVATHLWCWVNKWTQQMDSTNLEIFSNQNILWVYFDTCLPLLHES